jgi:hypothetical protein
MVAAHKIIKLIAVIESTTLPKYSTVNSAYQPDTGILTHEAFGEWMTIEF